MPMTKKSWNLALWGGFCVVLFGLLSYVPIFVPFPITRDFPWANLLLFLGGWIWLIAGLNRAFRQPERYRGKIFGSIFGVVSFAGVALFLFGLFYLGRMLPASPQAPGIGQKAPDFTLLDQNGKLVALADLLASKAPPGTPAPPKPGGALLIFYRGYW